MRGALTTCLLTAMLLAGCTDTADAPSAGPSSPAISPPSSSSPTAVPPVETPPPSRPAAITIAVAGDVHFEGVLRDRLDDPATALAPVTAALADADVAIVNLETSVGEGGRPDPTKRFTFQAPPAAFAALVEAGVDVATMANNHALDYGRDALTSTFAAIDATPLEVVGIGRNVREAFAPALVDVDGTVVATIGATTADLDPTADPTGQWAATRTSPGTADAVRPRRLLAAVESADESADVVVVYVHWGVQGDRCPSADQRRLAAELVEHGADVVVGSHAHVLQGDGRLDGGYVAYGLGNYVWYQPSADPTGVLTLTVRPPVLGAPHARVTEAVWHPARIGADGLPAALADVDDFRDELRTLRACAGFG